MHKFKSRNHLWLFSTLLAKSPWKIRRFLPPFLYFTFFFSSDCQAFPLWFLFAGLIFPLPRLAFRVPFWMNVNVNEWMNECSTVTSVRQAKKRKLAHSQEGGGDIVAAAAAAAGTKKGKRAEKGGKSGRKTPWKVAGQRAGAKRVMTYSNAARTWRRPKGVKMFHTKRQK